MATTKKLVIEVDTPKGGSKKYEFNSPKSGLTKAHAEAFVDALIENSVVDENTVGIPTGLIEAYYIETTTTMLV